MFVLAELFAVVGGTETKLDEFPEIELLPLSGGPELGAGWLCWYPEILFK